jgi:hypothetical protein
VQSEFALGESQKFDVTGDGFYDMLVTLDSVDAGKVSVTVSYIHEEVIMEESSGSNFWWIWVFVALAFAAAVFWLRRKK